MIDLFRVSFLFAVTACAELVGCYLAWLVIKEGKTIWLLGLSALALGLFAWLLTRHPGASGRVYASYGCRYIAMALLWLRYVDGMLLTRWDMAGGLLALSGMVVIAMQPVS